MLVLKRLVRLGLVMLQVIQNHLLITCHVILRKLVDKDAAPARALPLPLPCVGSILVSMTIIADTLQAKKRLLEAGFTDEKAEGIIGIFNEADAQVATKLDLELFRKDIKSEMDKRFDEVDKRFGEVDKRFGEMDVRFEKMANLILKAQFAGVVTTIVVLSALRFFV